MGVCNILVKDVESIEELDQIAMECLTTTTWEDCQRVESFVNCQVESD